MIIDHTRPGQIQWSRFGERIRNEDQFCGPFWANLVVFLRFPIENGKIFCSLSYGAPLAEPLSSYTPEVAQASEVQVTSRKNQQISFLYKDGIVVWIFAMSDLKGEYKAVDCWLAGRWDGHGHEDADDGGARSSRGGLPHSTTSRATSCLNCWWLLKPVKLWGAWPVGVLLRRQNPWRWEKITEVHDYFFYHASQVTTQIHQSQVVARLSLGFVYNSIGRRSMILKKHTG